MEYPQSPCLDFYTDQPSPVSRPFQFDKQNRSVKIILKSIIELSLFRINQKVDFTNSILPLSGNIMEHFSQSFSCET